MRVHSTSCLKSPHELEYPCKVQYVIPRKYRNGGACMVMVDCLECVLPVHTTLGEYLPTTAQQSFHLGICRIFNDIVLIIDSICGFVDALSFERSFVCYDIVVRCFIEYYLCGVVTGHVLLTSFWGFKGE